MIRLIILGLALALTGPARAAAPGAQLPAAVSANGSLDRVPSPDGQRVAFVLFERGDHTYVGVAATSGAIRWHRDAGIRPLVETFWSADGSSIMVVTDCVQPEAELKVGKPGTASWLIVLDAADGHLLGQGDLDTDVLDLPHQLPDATGASHVITALTLDKGMVAATIKHRGREIRGSCPFERLKTPAK